MRYRKLSFNIHVDNLCKKTNRKLYARATPFVFVKKPHTFKRFFKVTDS